MIDAYVLPIMFKENATNLNNISVDKGIEWLQSFDTILSDCDGKWKFNPKINKNKTSSEEIRLNQVGDGGGGFEGIKNKCAKPPTKQCTICVEHTNDGVVH